MEMIQKNWKEGRDERNEEMKNLDNELFHLLFFNIMSR
jgi:hypothetical protein